jgi:hypothetical protein
LKALEEGRVLESDIVVENLEAWVSDGCPLARFLLKHTVGAGLETAVVYLSSSPKLPMGRLRHAC